MFLDLEMHGNIAAALFVRAAFSFERFGQNFNPRPKIYHLSFLLMFLQSSEQKLLKYRGEYYSENVFSKLLLLFSCYWTVVGEKIVPNNHGMEVEPHCEHCGQNEIPNHSIMTEEEERQ